MFVCVANVHRQSFFDALQSERLRDRQALQSVKMLGTEDVMDETTKVGKNWNFGDTVIVCECCMGVCVC